MRTRLFWIAVMAGIGAALLSAGVALAGDKILFDFEEADSVNAWSNIDMHALREAEAKAARAAALKASPDPSKVPAYKPLPAVAKEPDVKIEWTTEGATCGQHAMKLTFAGGRMPTSGGSSTRSRRAIPGRSWRCSAKARRAATLPIPTENSRAGSAATAPRTCRWPWP
jgi:hypothetical protein